MHDVFPINICSYKSQFASPKRIVLAPIHFVGTKYIDRLKFDIIWLEEDAFKFRELKPPSEKMLETHEELLGFRPSHDWFIFEPEKLKTLLLNAISKLDRKEAIKKAKAAFKQNFNEIAEYYEREARGRKPDVMIPYLWDIFDLALNKNAKIIITDATFNKEIYKHIVAGFYGETGNSEVFKFANPKCIALTSTTCTESIVFKIGKEWYPRQSLANKTTLSHVASGIVATGRVLRYLIGDTIPVITYKKFKEKLRAEINKHLENDPYLNNRTVKILHFGDLRTVNVFSGYKVCFVVGTFNIGEEEFRKLLEKLAPIGVLPKTDYEYIPDTLMSPYVPKDKTIQQFKRWIEHNEQYQALHRPRPLRKPTVIAVWGAVPASLESEGIRIVCLKSVSQIPRYVRKPKPEDILNCASQLIEEYCIKNNTDMMPHSQLYDLLKSKYPLNIVNKVLKQLPSIMVKHGRGRPQKYYRCY